MDMDWIFALSVSVPAAFLLTAVSEFFLIPRLRSVGMGQKILEIGPRWHKNKEGTPTMGGLAFLFSSLLVFLFFVIAGIRDLPFLLAYGFAFCNGCVGLIDDHAKFVRKRNEGLTASQKYLLQVSLAVLYVVFLAVGGNFPTDVKLFSLLLPLWIFAYPFAVFFLTGFVNAVNLTDGVDGLASCVTLVVCAFFALFSAYSGDSRLAVLSGTGAGICLGFLLFNFHPAKVFMGDTGSLFLGGLVCGSAFLSGQYLILLIVGIVYLCESFSVILQVGYFKLTKGKRLFRMAPIHHHFEKCGWGEILICAVFSLVTLLASAFCALALFL